MTGDERAKAEQRMKEIVEATRREFAQIRTGRANPALLDRVTVEAYGDVYPINQLASISVPEARLLVIQPWDRKVLPNIERVSCTACSLLRAIFTPPAFPRPPECTWALIT